MTGDLAGKAELGKGHPARALGLLTDSADGIEDRARASVTRVGIGSNFWTDLYHHALTTSWPRFMGWSTIAYFVVNLAFALLYRLCNARINNAADLDLLSLFFFSVQTLSTVGYGVMAPTGHMANALVSVEALLGMMINALSTGVVFAPARADRVQQGGGHQQAGHSPRALPAAGQCAQKRRARDGFGIVALAIRDW